MQDLRAKTIRAGLFIVGGRGVSFVVRITSLMILGRLLEPADYGLVVMVTAFTGVLNMFGSFGLFQAAIQRDNLTEQQASTLFWINLLFGALLTLGAVALAPAVSVFYHEPRLTAIMMVVATGFLITGAGVQHGAHLHRQMRFGSSALIDLVALLVSSTTAVAMAMAGFGYWAVVSPTVTLPLATTIGLWVVTGWIPGPPRAKSGIRSMLHFGGTMTLNGLVSAITLEFDKLLVGRLWGATALGAYGRAYHLVWFPCDNLNTTIGEVAFAALSRTKHDPERRKRYFLKGYALVVAVTLPLTAICALFAEDIIAVALGPKWQAAVPIFRLLAPTIAVFAISNPLGWLMNSLGLVRRSLYIGLVSGPLTIAGISAGVPYGPTGVAAAYSTIMVLKVLPIAAWALRGTGIYLHEMLQVLARPLGASLVAGAIAYAGHLMYGPLLPLLARLAADLALFGATYLTVLLFVAGQGALYLDVLRAARASA